MSSTELEAEAIVEGVSGGDVAPIDFDALPSLATDPSFLGMTATQFLGAFNDNLFKQLVLLLSISAAGAEGANGDGASDNQWLAMLVFSAPFLIFTGYAGFLADRYSKRAIVVLCKMAEIVVMAAGGLGFYLYSRDGSMWALYATLFLMAAQSAFFGPAKYGILPEMLRPQDLPRANGFMLMTTFLAVIFGTAVAGVLMRSFGGQLWVGSAACIGIAVVGTITSLWVRRAPIANPGLKFEWEALGVPSDMREMLRGDRPLLMALLVSSVFWMLASMVPSAVNSLGTIDLQVGDDRTSYLNAVIGVGIAVGCAIGGLISKGRVNFGLLKLGSVGLIACMALLAIPGSGDAAALKNEAGELTRVPGINESAQWLGFTGSMPVMVILGAATGLFAVPLQVFMQSRPPDDKKGRMIAVMNQANWIGIVAASGVYFVVTKVIELQGWSRCVAFGVIAALMLPISLFYHPKNEELA